MAPDGGGADNDDVLLPVLRLLRLAAEEVLEIPMEVLAMGVVDSKSDELCEGQTGRCSSAN
jgi:hypothetical protein